MTLVNEPDVRHFSLGEIFRYRYQIPKFQRDYSWQKDNVKELIEDLSSLLERPSGWYFLGQIVVTKEAPPEDPDRQFVVDGQQRLVTLQLLVIYLHRRILAGRHSEHAHVLLEMFQHRADIGQPAYPRISMSEKGNEFFHRLISNTELPSASSLSSNTEKNLLSSWQQINESLDEEDDEQIVRFATALRNKTVISRLQIGSISEAIEVFEAMNQRGLKLTDSELMKNFLFRNISDRDYDDFSRKWDEVASRLYEITPKRLASFNFLLRAELISRTGHKIPSDGLLKEWEGYLIGTSTSPAIQSPHQFIKDLPEFARVYANLTQQKRPDGQSFRVGAGLKFFNSVQHIPVLLGGRKLENFDALIRIVEDRVLLSLFSKEGPQNFEKIIPEWAKSVRKLSVENPLADSGAIAAASEIAFDGVSELWKSYELRFEALQYRDSKKVRFALARVLQLLEQECGGDEISYTDFLVGGKKKHQIDHIEPRSSARAESFIKDDVNLIESIGNLVLIRGDYNASMRDKDPSEKIPYYSQTNQVVTQILCPQESLSIPVGTMRRDIVRKSEEVNASIASWSATAVTKLQRFYMHKFAETLQTMNPPMFHPQN